MTTKVGQIVKYFPSNDDEKLKKVLEKNRTEYLSAKIITVHADNVVDLTVSIPGELNVLKTLVTAEKEAAQHYEKVELAKTTLGTE